MMPDFIASIYPWTKAFHIISVITWMAGIFYLPRLFVYHSMDNVTLETSNIFKTMEYKLYKYIMNPSLFFAWIFGLLCLFTPGIIDFKTDIWFHIKFLLVILLTVYHFYLGITVKVFQLDKNIRNDKFYRYLNEFPTILMIVIVILVIIRPFS